MAGYSFDARSIPELGISVTMPSVDSKRHSLSAPAVGCRLVALMPHPGALWWTVGGVLAW